MTSKIHAIRRQGYELLHHGAIELARVEHNGIFINVDLLESTRRELESKMRKLEKALREPWCRAAVAGCRSYMAAVSWVGGFLF